MIISTDSNKEGRTEYDITVKMTKVYSSNNDIQYTNQVNAIIHFVSTLNNTVQL